MEGGRAAANTKIPVASPRAYTRFMSVSGRKAREVHQVRCFSYIPTHPVLEMRGSWKTRGGRLEKKWGWTPRFRFGKTGERAQSDQVAILRRDRGEENVPTSPYGGGQKKQGSEGFFHPFFLFSLCQWGRRRLAWVRPSGPIFRPPPFLGCRFEVGRCFRLRGGRPVGGATEGWVRARGDCAAPCGDGERVFSP